MRSRTILAASVAALLSLPLLADSAGKRALLIGINDYTASTLPTVGTSPVLDRDWSNLDGAVNDAELMCDVLQSSYEFTPSGIVMLTDQQATRAAIEKALRHLAATAQPGEVIVFYYSGHGSQVRNSLSAEKDKLDETLVPADSRRGAKDIRDKELRDWFNQILDRGARLTVMIDACHSGSGARGLENGMTVRQVKPDLRDAADGSIGPRPEDCGALVLSAAQDFHEAFETKDAVIRGAFTWAFVRALRDFARDEPVDETFARAQALLHFSHPGQEPVIAATPAVRARPFVGEPVHRRGGRSAIAVERVEANGRYLVQGGWINGLTVGSELRFAGKDGVRLLVKALRGISRVEAEVIPSPLARRAEPIEAGDLLEVAAWAPPEGRPLRIWMPRPDDDVVPFAQRLRTGAQMRGIAWIEDPTEATPTHLLRWRDGDWELLAAGCPPQTAASLEEIPPGASLFVQLPASAAIAEAMKEVPEIEIVSDPASADYLLAGRITGAGVEYALIRPHASVRDSETSPLPARTAWTVESSAFALAGAANRLQRIHGWLELESPPGTASYYSLAICRTDDRKIADDHVLLGEHPHHLVLRAKAASAVFTRYLYVFTIDSAGASVLLFPRANSGSVENRLPYTTEAGKPIVNPPREIPLDESEPFLIGEPYGADTFFLLSTDEPLLTLASLQWTGVRGKEESEESDAISRPPSPLERLLARKIAGTRGDPGEEAIRVPPNWSLEKVTYRSVAPGATTP